MPEVITRSRTGVKTLQGELLFKPYFVQKGRGPNLLDWAYASDKNWDAFHSNIASGKDGVMISDTEGIDKFGIDVRWNVEGFGYIYVTADNGGEYYTLPQEGKASELNLNYELAKSRVFRNRRRLKKFTDDIPGWKPAKDAQAFLDLSEDFFSDAEKFSRDGQKCAGFSQTALYYAMWGGEKLELSKAQSDIQRRGFRPNFFIGCDARGFFQMDPDTFMEDFTNLFNYATITHYLKSNSYQDFEPIEGQMQFDLRDAVLKRLRNKNITVEGRPLFWFYETVTPDWLRKKSYDELRKYVEKHAR
ncbi:MAG: hypothetical protein ACM3QX_08045, partial [Syntrophomonadaceae bacterium]